MNELLIVAALRPRRRWACDGSRSNFAVFRSALERGERLGAGPVLRAWRAVLIFVSRWFQIESLYASTLSSGRCWEPRYLVYPQASDIPRIAMAALEAEAFLVMPNLRSARWARSAARALVSPFAQFAPRPNESGMAPGEQCVLPSASGVSGASEGLRSP